LKVECEGTVPRTGINIIAYLQGRTRPKQSGLVAESLGSRALRRCNRGLIGDTRQADVCEFDRSTIVAIRENGSNWDPPAYTLPRDECSQATLGRRGEQAWAVLRRGFGVFNPTLIRDECPMG